MLGRPQIDKKDGSSEKKGYTWREKEKWKMKKDADGSLILIPDPNCSVNPTQGGTSCTKEVGSFLLEGSNENREKGSAELGVCRRENG